MLIFNQNEFYTCFLNSIALLLFKAEICYFILTLDFTVLIVLENNNREAI